MACSCARERTHEDRNFRPDLQRQCDGNEEYLTELAAYVDKKMRAVSESTQLVDSVKVAVLAALNIADETFTLRQRTQKLEGPIRQRMENCVSLVEKALEQTN